MSVHMRCEEMLRQCEKLLRDADSQLADGGDISPTMRAATKRRRNAINAACNALHRAIKA